MLVRSLSFKLIMSLSEVGNNTKNKNSSFLTKYLTSMFKLLTFSGLKISGAGVVKNFQNLNLRDSLWN
jgi:hypothetical protein